MTDFSGGEQPRNPIACDLSSLTPSERGIRARLAEELRRGVVEVVELHNGYAFQLDAQSSMANQVQEFVRLEQACCPFLTFRVRQAGAAGGPLRVEITGPEGTKKFLLAEFGIPG